MLQTLLDSPLLTMTRPTLGTRGFSRVRRTEMAAEGRWHCTSGEYRAGHNRDMTDTGNRARKTSGTQGNSLTALSGSITVLSLTVGVR